MYTNTNPLLSIVIPTRNRQDYVVSAISSILEIECNDFELVIQDNSDSSELREQIKAAFNDTRILYSYSPTPLSFIDNFEKAISISTGSYICIIGDDDGVNPEIIEAARWCQANDIDALTPTTCATYLWPGSGISSTLLTHFPQNSGLLSINTFTGKIFETKPEYEINKIVLNGGQDYLGTNIPKLYHGIVSRKCLDNVHSLIGSYFGGLSPDIFIAIGIANCAIKAVSIDYPLTIPGACNASGSVQSAIGGHTGQLIDAPHFNNRGPYKWADIVPQYYSVPTIWADSVIAALKALNRDDLLQNFNFTILAAFCICAHPKYIRIILHDFYIACHLTGNNYLTSTLKLLFYMLKAPMKKIIRRVVNRFRIIVNGDTCIRINEVNDMVAAKNTLIKHLKDNGHSFLKYVYLSTNRE
jgi:glycosyltransferase involved in cell wall biosynthesis